MHRLRPSMRDYLSGFSASGEFFKLPTMRIILLWNFLLILNSNLIFMHTLRIYSSLKLWLKWFKLLRTAAH